MTGSGAGLTMRDKPSRYSQNLAETCSLRLFGKPDELMAYLGVIPGAVTGLGVINDTVNAVTLSFD